MRVGGAKRAHRITNHGRNPPCQRSAGQAIIRTLLAEILEFNGQIAQLKAEHMEVRAWTKQRGRQARGTRTPYLDLRWMAPGKNFLKKQLPQRR